MSPFLVRRARLKFVKVVGLVVESLECFEGKGFGRLERRVGAENVDALC